MLIAIDGPAGSGKSTVAREVARTLGYSTLDSGAMYRCVGLATLGDPRPAGELARSLEIEFVDGGRRVLLGGEDVSVQLRSTAVSEAASRVAADPEVRAALVERQRELTAAGGWVAEGRDIGTVVAPGAQLKVFLTADPDERARRRAVQLGADEPTVLAEQTLRDQRDSTREHSPLASAADAVVLDTTALSIEAVVARIVDLARSARASSAGS